MADLSALIDPNGPNRLLIEAELTPVMGRRFQPTGFPDLGAATYDTEDGEYLIVESSQSMANRLEAVCWSEGEHELIAPLTGLSYIKVVDGEGTYLTSTITEAHRLNSPYILESKDKTFFNQLKEETKGFTKGPLNRPALAKTLFSYDVGTLIHGVFLAKSDLGGGRLRVERALSSFIEAEGVRVAALGGVKFDQVDPKGETNKGFGHVPFHRDEYTAKRIVAYFKLDVAQIRAYGLPEAATTLLMALGLFKVARFLEGEMRLRTSCDLELKEITKTKGLPGGLPSSADLAQMIPSLIEQCSELFATEGGLTVVTWKK